jgi:hypothetical protein
MREHRKDVVELLGPARPSRAPEWGEEVPSAIETWRVLLRDAREAAAHASGGLCESSVAMSALSVVE